MNSNETKLKCVQVITDSAFNRNIFLSTLKDYYLDENTIKYTKYMFSLFNQSELLDSKLNSSEFLKLFYNKASKETISF